MRLVQVIQMLKQFKNSTNTREQEVFACMIHNLFDEYRFFPRYPDKVRVQCK
jgi:CCR4-NOT transcription complex subunit 1